jgi:NTP pyrophosphatase (non-canonical NTP hydrolase)
MKVLRELGVPSPRKYSIDPREHGMASIRDIDEFEKFIASENERVARRCGLLPNEEKFILMQMLKTGEEVGELDEAILGYYGYQRREKPVPTKQDVSHEIADSIVTLWLLGAAMGIDVGAALDEKIAIILERDY